MKKLRSCLVAYVKHFWGPRGFGELGNTGNYLRGAMEQAHNFGDIGSLAKKQNNKEKPPFCLIFF